MVYSPVKDNKRITLIFFLGVIVILTLFILSFLKIINEVICQVTFFVEAVFYTFLFNKFVLPTYTYVLNEDSFVITKDLGKKNVLECNIEIDRIVDIVEYKKYKKQENTEVKSVYNYCANIFVSSCYCLIFEYSDCRECVIFEPCEEMVNQIKLHLHSV